MYGILSKKTFDEELEENFLNGLHNKCICEIPIDELLKDVTIEFDFNFRRENIDRWILVKQNKVKGEWLITEGYDVTRPILLIQYGSDYEDVKQCLGDSEFDRWNFLNKDCCLQEAREIIAKQIGLKQGDVGVRLNIGFSINYKELKI